MHACISSKQIFGNHLGSLQSVAGSAFFPFFCHTIDLMHNDVTRSDVKRAVNYCLCGHKVGKYFKMATVGREYFEVLNRLLEAVQTNEDSSSFENSCTSPLWMNNSESHCSSQLSSSNFTRRSGGAGGYTCCVSDCSSTIKGIQSFPFTAFLVVKVKSRKNFERGGLISFHVRIYLLQLAIESARCIFLGDVKPI